jgi:Zn-dependent peptidase ImmA (M78 family)
MKRLPTDYVVPANHKMIRWAREKRRWTKEEASDALKIPVATLTALEDGTADLTYHTLLLIADGYEVSSSAFLAPAEPPRLPPATERRSGHHGPIDGSIALRQALGEVYRLWLVYREMLELNSKPFPKPAFASRQEADPERAALAVRAQLGIDISAQCKWPYSGAALLGWRRAVETLGIPVFQVALPPDEVRGASYDAVPSCIALSKDDAQNGRIFTLMHELGHLYHGQSGICFPTATELDPRKTEGWCNRFAGALLLPKSEIESNAPLNSVATLNDADAISLLTRTSAKYKVSRLAIVTRLRVLGYMNQSRYDGLAEEIKTDGPKGFARGGKFTLAKSALNKSGHALVSEIFRGLRSGKIGPLDASGYLGVRAKHLETLAVLMK